MTDPNGIKYDYTKKDVILYNLGLGAKQSDLAWVFEGSPSFEVLPSFGEAVLSPVRRHITAGADL
jgi:multifunctional beta-oxidation protein